MLERYLIDCCSPTLASLKTGSLFNYTFAGNEDFDGIIERWNDDFSTRGLHVYVLRRTRTGALIYVYRESSLLRVLGDRDVLDFLAAYGYCEMRCNIDCYLEHLKYRILTLSDGHDSMKFPHEIGIFLGYPLCDVTGFIRYKGSNCKCLGDWKVYGDEEQAEKKFAQFTKCRNAYRSLWESGRRSVMQLTVAG